MITALDFGCSRIRSAFRNPDQPGRLTIFAERSEYAIVPNDEHHRRILEEQKIPHAVCEGEIAVAGNQSVRVDWLTRLPGTSLMPDGIVPTDDPPARQLLHMLVEAILPRPSSGMNVCGLVVPGAHDQSDRAALNQEFLCRLVRMQGYEPLVVHAAEAAILSTGSDTSFTGISIVIGAETSELCIARYGMPLATVSLPVGSNWMDTEIARQFRIELWDGSGGCYLDLESVRKWKHNPEISLYQPLSDRERMLSRLYSVVLDRIIRSVSQLLAMVSVSTVLNGQRLAILLSGGAVRVAGFASLLTERLIEHDLAQRVLAVRVAADPEFAVVRGALISAELDARLRLAQESAA